MVVNTAQSRPTSRQWNSYEVGSAFTKVDSERRTIRNTPYAAHGKWKSSEERRAREGYASPILLCGDRKRRRRERIFEEVPRLQGLLDLMVKGVVEDDSARWARAFGGCYVGEGVLRKSVFGEVSK